MQEKAETQHDEEIGNEGGIKGGKKQKRKQSQKRQMVGGTRALPKQIVLEVEGGEQGRGP